MASDTERLDWLELKRGPFHDGLRPTGVEKNFAGWLVRTLYGCLVEGHATARDALDAAMKADDEAESEGD